MPLLWNRNYYVTKKTLKQLFTDVITNQPLKAPILWGRHTLSENTISNLKVFKKRRSNYLFIKHPYTREVLQLTSHAILPENLIIQDLLLLFSYCNSVRMTNKQLHNMFIYFINALLIQQKKLNCISYIKIINNIIQDVLLNDIVKLFNCTKAVLKILTAKKLSQISIYYRKYRPSDQHLNGILFKAIKQNNSRLINLILSKNIKLDHKLTDKHDKTALHWSCYHNNYQLTKILLKQQADPAAQDVKGVTPIKIAKDNNNIKIIRLLDKYNRITVANQSCLFNYNYLISNSELSKSQYEQLRTKQKNADLRNRYRY